MMMVPDLRPHDYTHKSRKVCHTGLERRGPRGDPTRVLTRHERVRRGGQTRPPSQASARPWNCPLGLAARPQACRRAPPGPRYRPRSRTAPFPRDPTRDARLPAACHGYIVRWVDGWVSRGTQVSRCWVLSILPWQRSEVGVSDSVAVAVWRSRFARWRFDALSHRVGLCSCLLLELVYPGGSVRCNEALHLELLLRCAVEFCRRRQARFQLSHAPSLSLAGQDEVLSLLHQLADV